MTALKALQICGESLEGNNAAFYNDVDHEAVLRAQNKRLKSEGKIWVLGMCLLFILEYSANMVDVLRKGTGANLRLERVRGRWGANGKGE